MKLDTMYRYQIFKLKFKPQLRAKSNTTTSSNVTPDEGPLRQSVSPMMTDSQHLWRLLHLLAYFDYNSHAVMTAVLTTIDGWGTSGYS